VNNIIKHSGGTEGEIYIFSTANHVVLNVKDNGKCTSEFKEGFGLKNIKSRVSKLEGQIDVLQNESGTDIIVKVPFKLTPRTSLDNTHVA
jgi:signal transduction histidine kinase